MICSHDQLNEELQNIRLAGKSICFTNGCFDILHAGHVVYLDEAKKLGDVLVVGLNTDASVRRQNKGPERPINSEADRGIVLSALRAVDFVVLFDEDTPLNLIESLKPNVLVKGGDYTPEQVVGREIVEALGGRVAIVPLVPGKSTTALVRKLTALSSNS